MKKIYLAFISLYLLLMFIGAGKLKAQDWEWARKADATTDLQSSQQICADNAGNVFALGLNSGTATYNTTILNSGYFIVKYDTYGNVMWAQNIQGRPRRILCDDYGNLYVLGNFDSTVAIGSYTFSVNGNSSFYFAKINSGGILQWAKAFGDTAINFASDFAIDKDGSIFITGYYSYSITFDTFTLFDSTQSSLSFFIAKLNAAGNTQWANSGPNNYPSPPLYYYAGSRIKLTPSGSMYILGKTVTDPVDDECSSYFIMKCDASGQMQVRREHFDNCFNSSLQLAVDDNSNVFYIFNYAGHYYYEPVLAKYDSMLNHQWNLPLSNGAYYAAYSLYKGLSTDSEGNIYVAGQFGCEISGDTIHAYNRSIIRNGAFDILVAKFNGSSQCQWLKSAGGRIGERTADLFIDKKGICYLAGNYNLFWQSQALYDTVYFDNQFIYNDGNWNQMFVAKLNPPLPTAIQTLIPNPNTFIQIFPNPTHGLLNVECKIQNAELNIYNYLGEKIHHQILNQQSEIINLSAQPKGVYFLAVGNTIRKITLIN
jgi:hypothetical protein